MIKLLTALAAVLPAIAQTAYLVPYADGSDGWNDAYQQAKALVAQMTLEEKLNITQQSISNAPVGAVERLGYPGLFYADGSEGIRGAPFASSTPQALTAAASWDKDLWYRRAKIIGQEARIKGITTQFGPGVNLMRTPQAGRAFEYNGADPYLAGQAAVQHVHGQVADAAWLQDQGVMAMVRHYIGNEEETGRQWTSSNIDDRTAHELYVWPFQNAIHAGCVSVMCSYNGLNGTYACADPTSLGKWLHEELNFQGWVLSDFGSVYEGTEIDAARTGLDSVIGFTTPPFGRDGAQYSATPFGANSTLSRAIEDGTVPPERLDDMVTRIVSSWYKVGQSNGFPSLDLKRNALNQESNDILREIGAKSIVLLKNERDALPLEGGGYISVFGQAATVGLNGFPSTSGFGFSPSSDPATFAGGFGASYANNPYLITPFEALQAKARETRSQINAYFNNLNHTMQASYAATAGNSGGVCIVDLRTQCGEGYDRQNLTASFEGEETVRAVASGCNNTVVVYSSCGPFDTVGWYDHENVTAILDAGGLGQESGNAIVDVLFGVVNPGGKLPYTLAANMTDYPALADTTLQPNNVSLVGVNYTEGLFIDYRHFDKANIEPIYPFGYGLSYTTFKLTNIAISAHTDTLSRDAPADSKNLYDTLAWVSVDLCNTGDKYGTEVPQVCIGSPAEGAPVKVLRGFEATHLNPGETKRVTFELTRRDLSYWNVYIAGWTIPEGDHRVYVGNSSRDVQQSGNITFALYNEAGLSIESNLLAKAAV